MFGSIIEKASEKQKNFHRVNIGEKYYSPGLISHTKDTFRFPKVHMCGKPSTFIIEGGTALISYDFLICTQIENISLLMPEYEYSILGCELYIQNLLHSKLTGNYIRRTTRKCKNTLTFRFRFNSERSVSIYRGQSNMKFTIKIKSKHYNQKGENDQIKDYLPQLVLYVKEYVDSEIVSCPPLRPPNDIRVESFRLTNNLRYFLGTCEEGRNLSLEFSGLLYGFIFATKNEKWVTQEDKVTIKVNGHAVLDDVPIACLVHYDRDCLSYLFCDFYGHHGCPENIFLEIPEQQVSLRFNLKTKSSIFIDLISCVYVPY